MRSKRNAIRIHRSIGLAAAVVIAIQALTGISIVYRTELAQILGPVEATEQGVTEAAPLGRVMHATWAEHPGHDITRINYPARPGGNYFVYLVDATGSPRYAYVSTGAAQVLRTGGIWRFPTEAALFIHFNLMAGRFGQCVLVLSGFAVLFMLVTGLLYWWPPRHRWVASLTINRRLPAKAILRQLHRSLGVLAWVLIAFSATTGFCVAVSELVTSDSSNSLRETRTREPHIYESALRLTRGEFPDSDIRDVRFPIAERMDVYFRAPVRNTRAVHLVSIDLRTLEIRKVRPTAEDKSLLTILLPWHSGEFVPVAGRILVLVSGLALLSLATTGPIMWLWSRRR